MTDFDTAARQEAERRYPDRAVLFGGEMVEDMRLPAFEAGARWGADMAVQAATTEVRRLTAALAEAEALLDKPLDPDDPCAEHDDHIWTDLALDRLAALRAILARAEQTGGTDE